MICIFIIFYSVLFPSNMVFIQGTVIKTERIDNFFQLLPLVKFHPDMCRP